MSTASIVRLLLLSAIWGASFLFMRVSAPFLHPAELIFWRVGLGAVFLFAVSLFLSSKLRLRENWKHYLILGLLNAAIPFSLYAFAAKTVSASLLSILNSTAPIWASLIGSLLFKAETKTTAWIGMAIGLIGVVLLTGVETLALPKGGLLAIFAVLGATFCYGAGTNYAIRSKPNEAFSNAHGSMWGATALLAPFFFFSNPSPQEVPAVVVISILLLGVLCSGVAFLLYFRLVEDIGATSALTVTFLIPVFGVLWGVIFLGENFGWHSLVGTVLIFLGLSLVTGLERHFFNKHHSSPP